jgi:hypothetical protein
LITTTPLARAAVNAITAELVEVWTFTGDATGDKVGYAVGTAGDVNGDGFADVMVGAPKDYTPEGIREGVSRVFYGCAAGIYSALVPDWESGSGDSGSDFGGAVATAGDVNNDGYADIIIGAPTFHSDEVQVGAVGAAFVYHGSAAGLNADPAWQFMGEKESQFGIAVAGGNFNGDSYSDVIVGAGNYAVSEVPQGAVFVFYGSENGITSVMSQTLLGTQTGALFGSAVSNGGDVNGDGYGDIVVGARGYDNGNVENTGAIFVYFGSGAGLITPPWMFTGTVAAAELGTSVGGAGDVNGDGYADIIAGVPYGDNLEEGGRAVAFYGSVAGPGLTPNWQVSNDQPNALFGVSVGAAGDVNNDGFSDVIVGASHFTGDDSIGDDQFEEGAAFIYFGGLTGLEHSAGWHAEGGKASTWYGYSVGTAGDVNHDGYADVMVGAPEYRVFDREKRGRAFVYLGSASAANEGQFQVYLPVFLKGR